MEEATFVSALADGTMADTEFTDELFSRCRDAIIAAADTGSATPLDVAVLIRQVMRRASERDGIAFRMVLGPEARNPRRSGGLAERGSHGHASRGRTSTARGRAVPAIVAGGGGRGRRRGRGGYLGGP